MRHAERATRTRSGRSLSAASSRPRHTLLPSLRVSLDRSDLHGSAGWRPRGGAHTLPRPRVRGTSAARSTHPTRARRAAAALTGPPRQCGAEAATNSSGRRARAAAPPNVSGKTATFSPSPSSFDDSAPCTHSIYLSRPRRGAALERAAHAGGDPEIAKERPELSSRKVADFVQPLPDPRDNRSGR